jgi:hypothetical protein
MFDKNVVGPYRTFIYLKGVGKLGSNTSDVAESIKAKFFPYARPNGGGSSPYACSR